jgi:predicted DNA-binding transcriptional regulator YafY
MSSASVTRFFSQIEHACSSQTQLNLKYETIEHGPTERLVDPYFIVFRGRAFYFVAYCHLRKDFRTFRLDRIRQVKNLGGTFKRKRGIDARDYFAESWLVFSGEPVEVKVRFTGTAAKIVASSRHHSSETVEANTDGSVAYRVTVAGTHEIKRWILGFGEEAEVVRPKALREDLARSARKMVNAYASTRGKGKRNRRT